MCLSTVCRKIYDVLLWRVFSANVITIWDYVYSLYSFVLRWMLDFTVPRFTKWFVSEPVKCFCTKLTWSSILWCSLLASRVVDLCWFYFSSCFSLLNIILDIINRSLWHMALHKLYYFLWHWVTFVGPSHETVFCCSYISLHLTLFNSHFHCSKTDLFRSVV